MSQSTTKTKPAEKKADVLALMRGAIKAHLDALVDAPPLEPVKKKHRDCPRCIFRSRGSEQRCYFDVESPAGIDLAKTSVCPWTNKYHKGIRVSGR